MANDNANPRSGFIACSWRWLRPNLRAGLMALVTLGLAAPGRAALPDKAWEFVGLWEASDKNSVVRVYRCASQDEALCISIAWIPDPGTDAENRQSELRSRALCQLQIARYTRFDDDKWQLGSVYDPVQGKTYNSSVRLRDGRLKLRGFIRSELFGATESFTRIEALPAPCGQPAPKAIKP
jgi:uncharacterized protein (DUF2147 family)